MLALKGAEWEVQTIDKLPDGVQPQISVEELLLCEDIIRADERVIKLAKQVGEWYFLVLEGSNSPARHRYREGSTLR